MRKIASVQAPVSVMISTGFNSVSCSSTREAPELFERVVAGELSANAAAIKAGFRKKPIFAAHVFTVRRGGESSGVVLNGSLFVEALVPPQRYRSTRERSETRPASFAVRSPPRAQGSTYSLGSTLSPVNFTQPRRGRVRPTRSRPATDRDDRPPTGQRPSCARCPPSRSSRASCHRD
jgi:hypothetical protein